MTPLYASYVAIALWAVSWGLAALWSRRTAARPPALDQVAYLAPTVVGGFLVAVTARAAIEGWAFAFGGPALWRLSDWAGWALFGLCLLGLMFTWWARLTLGDLWSSSVQRKAGHTLVERGPYRLVRHPIYSGLILALTAASLELARPVGFLGTALLCLGFWMKARLEERFLSAELGEGAYADYRRRTPMLVPFWPRGA